MTTDLLSKHICIHAIPTKGIAFEWESDTLVLQALNDTRMPDDTTLKHFNAMIRLSPLPGSNDIIRLSGTLTGCAVMRCSVSGEYMDVDIQHDIEVDYANNMPTDDTTDETCLLPEPIDGEMIDIYESCIQEIILSLPSHVTKDGATFRFIPHPTKDNVDMSPKNPFHILQTLKQN